MTLCKTIFGSDHTYKKQKKKTQKYLTLYSWTKHEKLINRFIEISSNETYFFLNIKNSLMTDTC